MWPWRVWRWVWPCWPVRCSLSLSLACFWGCMPSLRAIELRSGEGKRAVVWPLFAAAMVVGLGALIGAVQALPFGEFVGLSHRIPGFNPKSVLPLWHLITLIVPDLFGNPASLGEYWGKINYSEADIYAGVVTLLLACLAPFVARQRRILAIGLAGVTAVLVYLLVGGPGTILAGLHAAVQLPGVQSGGCAVASCAGDFGSVDVRCPDGFCVCTLDCFRCVSGACRLGLLARLAGDSVPRSAVAAEPVAGGFSPSCCKHRLSCLPGIARGFAR